jgi:antitoxin (DNA-binding transcriptional repressor) of toxin-antitoxin stability system
MIAEGVCSGRNLAKFGWTLEEKIMSTIVTVEEAEAKQRELIAQLGPGDEVVITHNQQPVAKLVSQIQTVRQRPGPGLGKGMLTIVADDDEHLKDFAEYMPSSPSPWWNPCLSSVLIPCSMLTGSNAYGEG